MRLQRVTIQLFVTIFLFALVVSPQQPAQAADVWQNCGTIIPDMTEADCEFLVDLFNSTDGAGSWSNKLDWLDNNVPCNWYGISCSGGRLKTILLGGNNLNGSLPSSLSNLTAILDMDFTNNDLSGTIPKALGSLTTMEELSLSQNLFTGTIPHELGNLTNLQRLALSDNMLEGVIPASFGNLSNIKYIYLDSNNLSGNVPPELGSLDLINFLIGNNNNLEW
ncbi:MAG: hypothetical protein N2D54_12585, partial [Chloroflexota bacterium]